MKYILLFTFAFIMSCSSPPQTPNDFGNYFVKILKEKNTDDIKDLFLTSKKGITKLHKLVSIRRWDDEEEMEKSIERFYNRINKEIDAVIEKLISKAEDYNIKDAKPTYDFDEPTQEELDELKLNKGVRFGTLKINFDEAPTPFYIRVQMVDMNTGKFKIVEKPRIRTK